MVQSWFFRSENPTFFNNQCPNTVYYTMFSKHHIINFTLSYHYRDRNKLKSSVHDLRERGYEPTGFQKRLRNPTAINQCRWNRYIMYPGHLTTCPKPRRIITIKICATTTANSLTRPRRRQSSNAYAHDAIIMQPSVKRFLMEINLGIHSCKTLNACPILPSTDTVTSCNLSIYPVVSKSVADCEQS